LNVINTSLSQYKQDASVFPIIRSRYFVVMFKVNSMFVYVQIDVNPVINDFNG